MKTARYLMTVALLAMAGNALADDFAIADLTLNPGETKTISIELNNPEMSYIAFEFYMTLPEGISIPEDEDGYLLAELNNARINRHVLEVSQMDDGSYHFLCYSNRNTSLKETSGEIISLTVTAAENATPGTLEGKLLKQVLSDLDMKKVTFDDYTFPITVVQPESGLSFGEDVGTVTVTIGEEYTLPTLINPNGLPVTYSSSNEEVATVDASTGVVTVVGPGETIITASSEKNKAGFVSYILVVNPKKGDANGDGVIDLEDVMIVIDHILDICHWEKDMQSWVLDIDIDNKIPVKYFISAANINNDYSYSYIYNGDGSYTRVRVEEINLTDVLLITDIIMARSASEAPAVEVNEHTDHFSISDFEMVKGENTTVTIELNNSKEKKYNAFEFYLSLPEGVTIVEEEDSGIKAELNRSLSRNGWSMLVNQLADGTYHFICFNTKNGYVNISSEVISLTLKAAETMANGSYNGELLVPKLSDVSLNRIAFENFTFHVNIPDIVSYAKLDNGTLTFVRDNQYVSRRNNGETVYLLDEPNGEPRWFASGVNQSVTKVVFDESFANARPKSTHSWLRGMPLESIEGWENLNTSEVTNMDAMFYNTTSLSSVDLSHFDTSNVLYMSNMFNGCSNLTSLDLSTFDGSKVVNSDCMLEGCNKLMQLTLSSSMSGISSSACRGVGYWDDPCHLTVPDGFDFGDVDTTTDVFSWNGGWFHVGAPFVYHGPYVVLDNGTLSFYCDDQRANREGKKYKLNDWDTPPSWYVDGSNTTVTHVVFDPSFAEARPNSTYGWFRDMPVVSIEGLEYLNTSDVANMSYMFNGCSKLTELDLSQQDAEFVMWMEHMFSECTSLITLKLGNITVACDAAGDGLMSYMFSGCSSLTSIDLSGLKTYGLGMSHMFSGCSSLTSLDLSNFDTSGVADMSYMFSGCSSLTSLDLSNFDTSGVTNMSYMFNGCSSLTELDLSNFTILSYGGGDDPGPAPLDIKRHYEYTTSDGMLNGSVFGRPKRTPFSGYTTSDGMLNDCNSLRTLTLSSSMSNINWNACAGVGTEDNPCELFVPAGFDFYDTETSARAFQWAGGWFTLLPGDVNADRTVSVTDVMMTVNRVLGNQPNNFHPFAADVNNDNNITVTDIMSIVKIVLNGGSKTEPSNVRTTTNSSLHLTERNGEVAVMLDSTEPFTACEMTVTLPEGYTLEGANLDERRANGHHLAYSDLGDGRYRILVFSFSGNELPDVAAPLLHLSIKGQQSGKINVSQNLFTNRHYEMIALPDVSGAVTGIRDINVAGDDTPTYSIQGIKTKTPTRGVYIRDGRKVVVK